MAEESKNELSDVDALRLQRHGILSTALPFPKLDWTDREGDPENLARIRDYSESLANSTLDWYLRHHRSKKWWAQLCHRFIYLFVAVAGIPPLLKVGLSPTLSDACGGCGLNEHAGELSLLFLGLAAAFKLWDSNAGFTADWMRYIMTAEQIGQELARFQFEWDYIDLARRNPVPKKSPDATTLRQELAKSFCDKILKIVGGEIAVWAAELKRRVDQIPNPTTPHGK